MGACFHIAGVYCDNCKMGSPVLHPLINVPVTGDLAGPYPPPLATAAEVANLRAEVESLKKELDNLRLSVATLRAESEGTGPHPYRITACPRCCSSALYYSTIGSFDGKLPKYQITCRDCNWKRYD